jgi:parallel beta-helix repeat protein
MVHHTTQSTRKNLRHCSTPLSFLAIAFVALITRPASIWAADCAAPTPTCGCTMTADTTLTANLTCPNANGILFAGDNLTLSLNGFSITGNGDTQTSGVSTTFTGGTIQGPGTINAFGSGVLIRRSFSSGKNIVQNLTLDSNRFGVVVVNAFDDLIRYNTITSGFVGILFDNAASNKIKGNTISGHSAVGIVINGAGGSTVTQNSVTGNGDGLDADDSGGRLIVTCNDFSSNTGSGIGHIGGASTITGNTATNNGLDGIAISGSNSNLVQDNTTTGNARRGIGVVASDGNRILDNMALGNDTDLFWDGFGSTNCWALNVFGTSNMPLRSCP